MLRFIYIFVVLLIFTNVNAQKLVRVTELRGVWKFSIGDDKKWAEPNFDDSKWQDIFVPSSWEDEGYPGYDGYAWYRKTVILDKKDLKKNLYLRLGFIDDVDQVFMNGILIGETGTFPPFYETSYNKERFYRIPESVLNVNGKNVIAVRVYDGELTGGILKGYCGIYEKKYTIDLEISLEGKWKFKVGDKLKYRFNEYPDDNWNLIFAPENWEKQGFENYEGYAWYRKKVFVPRDLMNQELVLLLGKIDDLDQTFWNGEKIGQTGRMYDEEEWLSYDDEWLRLRAYEIDNELIRFGAYNLIAVRVFDGMVDGGIYEGPLGIVTEENYRNWKPQQEKKFKGIFEWLFGEK